MQRDAVTGTDRPRTTEVVDAAAQLFYDQGYRGTSIQDVADSLGILKGSIYYYIRTKEDLLYAVIQSAHTATRANLTTVKALESDVPAKIEAFVRGHLELMRRDQVKIAVYLRDYRALSDEHRRVISEERREYADFLEDLLRSGQKDGSVAYDLKPHVSTLAILGMLNWSHEWYRDRGAKNFKALTDEFARLTLRTIQPPR